MTNAEERAESYILANSNGRYDLDMEWEVRSGYIAGYEAAERYRVMLMAAIRNSVPQPQLLPDERPV